MQTGTKEGWNVAPLGIEDGCTGYSSDAGELSRRSSPLMFAESGDCPMVIVTRSLRGAVGIESLISPYKDHFNFGVVASHLFLMSSDVRAYLSYRLSNAARHARCSACRRESQVCNGNRVLILPPPSPKPEASAEALLWMADRADTRRHRPGRPRAGSALQGHHFYGGRGEYRRLGFQLLF